MCPLCSGALSEEQIIEDLESNDLSRISASNLNEILKKYANSKEIKSHVARWLGKNGDLLILKELYESFEASCREKVLVEAVKYGNIEMVRFVLTNSGDLHFVEMKYTEYAVRLGHLEIARLLYKNGYSDYKEAVAMAVKMGNLSILKMFLEHDHILSEAPKACIVYDEYPANWYTGKAKVTSGMSTAAANGHFKIVKYLLKTGQPCTEDTIVQAIRHKRTRIMKYLIEKGCPCSAKVIRFAAMEGNVKAVKYLVKTGQPSDYRAVDGAIVNGHIKIAKYLIKMGMSCSYDSFDFAAENGDLDLVKYLVRKKIPCSYGAVDGAMETGHLEVAKYLLEIGKPCSFRTIDAAASRGDVDMVKYLVALGKAGSFDAIELAVKNDHTDLAKYLIEKGWHCSSAVMDIAAGSGDLDFVRYLMENGKDCTAKGITNAASGGHLEIVKYLIANHKPCEWNSVTSAAKSGHWAIVIILAENGVRCDSRTIYKAFKLGHTQIIPISTQTGNDWNVDGAICESLQKNDFENAKLMIEMWGKPVSSSMIRDVIYYSKNLEMLKYLMERYVGIKVESSLVDRAAENDSWDILKYLLEQGHHCGSDKDKYIQAAIAGARPDVAELMTQNEPSPA